MSVRWAGRVLVCSAVLAGCGSDGTGPDAGDARILGVHPAPGSVDVPVAELVRVEYGASLQLERAPTVTLTRGDTPVGAAVTVPGGRALELRPADILELGTAYTVRVSGVWLAGGVAVRDTGWTFTTAGRVPEAPAAARLFGHAEALAHDSLRGRRWGTADELRAAQYIAAQLAAAGLSPAAGSGWLQGFTSGSIVSQNVLGVLPGAGVLAAEWVVIGAHYDHLGEGPNGVFNGADDNASGTAGLLELARLLSAHASTGGFGTQPRRSVLFAAFGAEEAGLVGSNWFCNHPAVPIEAVAGMLNLDMIGRLRSNTISAHGVGSAAQWPALLARYGDGLTINVGGTIGTDYRCFLERGRPALALFTGLHSDYHQVTDDAALLDAAGMARVAGVTLGLATNLMLRPLAPGVSVSAGASVR